MFKTVHNLVQDTSGNIAMLMAVSLGAVSVIMFGGIQFNNVITLRKGVQSAIDAAALTATLELGRGSSRDEARAIAERAFEVNVATLPEGLDPTVKPIFDFRIRLDDVFVEATYNSDLDLPLNGVLGLPTYVVNVQSNGFISVPRDEITMVLDVSVSMAGAKFASLKTATVNFANTIEPFAPTTGSYRVLNMVPFASRVNFGPEFDDLLGPETPTHPASFYEGCFEAEETATLADDDDAIAGELLPFEQRIQGGTGLPFCPPEESEVLLGATDLPEIMERIDGLQLAFGTGTSHALSWGWRTLSPEWRRHLDMPFNLPSRFSRRNRKVLILLTDGAIVHHRYETDATGIRNLNRQDTDAALLDFVEVCEQIEAQGEIVVYTIGFDLNAAADDLRDALIECASADGEYFDADTADLSSVFAQIADDVNTARLTE